MDANDYARYKRSQTDKLKRANLDKLRRGSSCDKPPVTPVALSKTAKLAQRIVFYSEQAQAAFKAGNTDQAANYLSLMRLYYYKLEAATHESIMKR